MNERVHPLATDRAFGVLVAVASALFAVSPIRHGAPPRLWLLPLSALCLLLAAVRPQLLGPANRWWRRLGDWLGRYVSPPLLALVYLLTFVPTAMVLRALRKDPLRRAWQPNATSYWIERSPDEQSSMRNQF